MQPYLPELATKYGLDKNVTFLAEFVTAQSLATLTKASNKFDLNVEVTIQVEQEVAIKADFNDM